MALSPGGPKGRDGNPGLFRQVRVIDVAPTLCYLMGWPMPHNVEGGVIYEAMEDADRHMGASS